MYKLRQVIASAALWSASMLGATQITVGSYNIRVLTSADTGPNHWDNRKEYVARTVTDNNFQVVGFNEVKSERQQTELKALLPGYSFFGWDGHEGYDSKDETAVDLVGWRTDMFDLLDKGWYFLCRNGESQVWECSWDNSNYVNARHTSWVKLQVKGSGEVFYFFCTHLDHQGNVARMLQSHMNYEKAWEIAGHYPTVFVGDQNSSTSRVNYLNLYKAGFTDAFSIVPNPAERFGKDDPATAGQWTQPDPVTSTGRRIDFIWVRGFTVDDYDHCTDTYDLGARPSDHVAITAKLTFEDPDLTNRYKYVRAGSSGNGSKNAPFGTISEAIGAARHGDTIYVAAGDYDITSEINVDKTLHLFGGYDESFGEITGRSSVKASGEIRCMRLRPDTDVEIRDFGIYNGHLSASNQDGGGIYAHGARLIMRNCELADNLAGRDGGGIDCTGQLILDHVRFLRNKAGGNGGGFCCDNPNKRYWFNFPIENCYFEENEAADGAAGYLPRFVYGYLSGNTFNGNKASAGSPLYLHAVSNNETSLLGVHLTVMNNTFTLNSGAGANSASALFVEIDAETPFTLINNTIVSNSTDDGKGAVYMTTGVPYVGNNIIAGNKGGDACINAAQMTASYNLYTSAESVNYVCNARDIYSDDYASSVSALAAVLDGKVADGRFVPTLSVADDDAVEAGAEVSAYAVPTVKVVNPVYAEGKNLNSVTALRLRENVLKGDYNNDCMNESTVSLATDQIGVPRPTNGKATMGAREYVVPAGIEAVWNDAAADSDAPVEYFDLQGRLAGSNPGAGLYLRRQGSKVDKVIVR